MWQKEHVQCLPLPICKVRILTPTAQDLGITPGPLPLTEGKVSLVWEGCTPQQWSHLGKKAQDAVGWAGMPVRNAHKPTATMRLAGDATGTPSSWPPSRG